MGGRRGRGVTCDEKPVIGFECPDHLQAQSLSLDHGQRPSEDAMQSFQQSLMGTQTDAGCMGCKT